MALAYSLPLVFIKATIYLLQMSRGTPHIIYDGEMMYSVAVRGKAASYELQYYDFLGPNECIALLLNCVAIAALCQI